MNSFVLLGIILGIIDVAYLVLISYLAFNDKVSVKNIKKSIIGYYAIMTAAILSMVIGIFAN